MQQDKPDISVGLDLLMNPKKKASSGSSDASSVVSESVASEYAEKPTFASPEPVKVQANWTGAHAYSTPFGNTSNTNQVVDLDLDIDDDYPDNNNYNSGYDGNGYGGFDAARPKVPAADAVSVKSYDTVSSAKDFGNTAPATRVRMTDDEILTEKRELLYQFDRLEKKGLKLPRKFTLASSLDEMRAEYERLVRDRETDNSIKFQRRMLMGFVTGIEFLNTKFDPFDVDLDGWAESIDATDYDDVFEELHAKYRGKAKMAPELKLLFMLGGSGVMFHLSKTMFKSSLPGLDQVMRQNPQLARQVAQATLNTMAGNAEPSNAKRGGAGGLAGLFGSFFGGGPGTGSAAGAPPPPPPPPPGAMKGPGRVDDILNELQRNAFVEEQRVDLVSNMSDTSSDAGLPDEVAQVLGGDVRPTPPLRGRPRARNFK